MCNPLGAHGSHYAVFSTMSVRALHVVGKGRCTTGYVHGKVGLLLHRLVKLLLPLQAYAVWTVWECGRE
jgi:hypothetical protein